MKKLFSIVLSLALCVSVILSNPLVEIGDEILVSAQNEQSEGIENVASPCEDSQHPGWGGDTPA